MATVEIRGLSKRFGATVALDGVDLTARAGTVHTILGENGSGKSTLIKVLAGGVIPDQGSVEIDGRSVPLLGRKGSSPAQMADRGVGTVHQEVLTAPNRSVVDNIHLGTEGTFRNRLGARQREEIAASLLDRFGLGDLDVRRPCATLPILVQQVVVICRALVREPTVLLLDESTAALGLEERRLLFELLVERSERDLLTLFVSHRLDEITSVSDTVTVMRSGRIVGQVRRGEFDHRLLLEMMAPQEAVV